MTTKITAALLTLLLATTSLAGPWDGAPTGKCYKTLNDFLATSFGNEYTDDENIKVVEAKDLSTEYRWVLDLTPGTNITRTLIFLNGGSAACVVLVAPFSSSIKVTASTSGIPTSITTTDTPAPGHPTTEVEYLPNKSGFYEAKSCFEKGALDKRRISCDKAFEEQTNTSPPPQTYREHHQAGQRTTSNRPHPSHTRTLKDSPCSTSPAAKAKLSA